MTTTIFHFDQVQSAKLSLQLSAGGNVSFTRQAVGSSIEHRESSLLLLGIGTGGVNTHQLLRIESDSRKPSRTLGTRRRLLTLANVLRAADL